MGIEEGGRAYRVRVERALEELSERERDALRVRYGLMDGVEHTIEEVAVELDMDAEEVRAIEKLVLARIRE